MSSSTKVFQSMLGVKEVCAGTMCCVTQPVTLTDLKVVAIVDEQTGSSGRMTQSSRTTHIFNKVFACNSTVATHYQIN